MANWNFNKTNVSSSTNQTVFSEIKIWEGRPSQWYNLDVFTLSVLFCWLIIPIGVAIWKIIFVSTWKIRVTNQRIIVENGVLSRKIEEVEFYRIQEINLYEPFYLRIFNLSIIELKTIDNKINVQIPAIKDGKQLKEQIREAIEIVRKNKVLKIDI